jgi:transposase InsO family protein
MKYQFIDAQSQSYGVRTLCKALDVSRSGYYAARRRPPSLRSLRRTGLTSQIRTIHDASRHTYGSPRVHAELFSQGVPCCRNTVAKLMRMANIVPKDPPISRHNRFQKHHGITQPAAARVPSGPTQSQLGERHHVHPNA